MCLKCAMQESFHEDFYTRKGLAHVQATTFKALLLRHYPMLGQSIGDVTNAFLAWTGTPEFAELDPGTCGDGSGRDEL
jgi:hypothetical protein